MTLICVFADELVLPLQNSLRQCPYTRPIWHTRSRAYTGYIPVIVLQFLCQDMSTLHLTRACTEHVTVIVLLLAFEKNSRHRMCKSYCSLSIIACTTQVSHSVPYQTKFMMMETIKASENCLFLRWALFLLCSVHFYPFAIGSLITNDNESHCPE